MYGVLCRLLLLYSSLASPTNLTVELSTPSSVAPDGLLMCLSDQRWAQQRSSTAVISVVEAQHAPWEHPQSQKPQDVQLVSPDESWKSSEFFKRSQDSPGSNLEPLETLDAANVLCSDPGLAATACSHSRCPCWFGLVSCMDICASTQCLNCML